MLCFFGTEKKFGHSGIATLDILLLKYTMIIMHIYHVLCYVLNVFATIVYLFMLKYTKCQTVSCDDFLPRTHAHSHTRFSAARTSHARVRFAKVRIAHAPRTCAVVRVRFIKIRTRTRTFLAKN